MGAEAAEEEVENDEGGDRQHLLQTFSHDIGLRDIYLAYPQAQCILHAHAPWCSTLACLERGIPAQHYMVALAGGPIRCTPYQPFGTQALSDAAVAGLAGRKPVRRP